MDASLFDYDLPADRIAQTPAGVRDASRLLVVNRATHQLTHATFNEIGNYLPSRTVLFRNNAMVLKARLQGVRPSGGKVECLLLHPVMDGNPWEFWCLLKPGKRLPVNGSFRIPGICQATVIAKRPDGTCRVAFTPETGARSVVELADLAGSLPLPPYIDRHKADPAREAMDENRYQTVYADPQKKVAAAAPTAGLHFTPDLMDSLTQQGHEFQNLTLHVGLGTFQPIKVERLDEHRMHREIYEVPAATRQAWDRASHKLCVGTTALRALEDYCRKGGHLARNLGQSYQDSAELFIYPPAKFLSADSLLTNFHLPRSTLLCLVSAFLQPESTEGIAWLKDIYRAAIKENYRFFSYGDAMLIL